VTTVRHAAAEILLALERGRTTLSAELERARHDVSDPRDRALLVEVCAGALRWRAELDALIAAASRRAVRQIDARALAVLRVAAYQVRHLQRVPPHAVVHEAVDSVRALGAPRAAGFVNAVLRALIRRGQALALPPHPYERRQPRMSSTGESPRAAAEAIPAPDRDAEIRYLTIALSHPKWLVERWLSRYGFDATETWCRFNNGAPDVTARPIDDASPGQLVEALRAAGVPAEPAPYVGDAIRLPPGALGDVPASLRARLLIQDEGAQLVGRAIGARPGERVLDVCAAPGGKTLVCAADMGLRAAGAPSLLVAGDFRPARVAVLRDTIARARSPVPIVRIDARRPLPFGPVFDAVVLDAPCSGLGTLRRDPDLKWSRAENDLPRLAADERRMIECAAACVRPGGRLIYATCSSEPEENGEVVNAFLAGHPQFVLGRVVLPAPASPALVDERGCLVTLPFRDRLDAFYAAVLECHPAA
jgi:16S rRNA (cytosine967-C5)-methyltransferase